MAKLSLMFESKLVKEVPIGSRPVSIGRSPDNDIHRQSGDIKLSRACLLRSGAPGCGRFGQLERNVRQRFESGTCHSPRRRFHLDRLNTILK